MNLPSILITGLLGIGMSTFRGFLTRTAPDIVPTVFDSSPQDEYDFVVVGAGVGGSVAASRLSETGATVLLLEAGESATPESAIPAWAQMWRLAPGGIWEFEDEPQKHAAFGCYNNSMKIQVAKMMGGLSSLNGMVYNRGGQHDYDNWARMGNPGWDYESVLPYFKKSERFQDSGVRVSDRYHGFTGPLPVEVLQSSKMLDSFLRAGRDLGFKIIDPSDPQQIGVLQTHVTLDNGVRRSASESFLAPVKGRWNLDIVTRATVRKVLFNRKKRAIGVSYERDGQVRKVRVRKEVVLSAGVLNTPKILMLSGIGPGNHLREMRIPVVSDVEGVGRNLQDHPAVVLTFTMSNGSATRMSDLTVAELKKFLQARTGLFTNTMGGDGYGFMKLAPGDHPQWPDTILSISVNYLSDIGTKFRGIFMEHTQNWNPKVMSGLFEGANGRQTYNIFVMAARPMSKGLVTLRSSNPSDPPVVDSRTFEDNDDLKLIVRGIRLAFQFANSKAMRHGIQSAYLGNVLKPCARFGYDSDAYWACFAQHVVSVGFHQTGTAKMAPTSDPLGVVSSRLKVRGVTGLRVLDASVMPKIVASNPMAATYLIGEMGSDFIKEDWGYRTDPLT